MVSKRTFVKLSIASEQKLNDIPKLVRLFISFRILKLKIYNEKNPVQTDLHRSFKFISKKKLRQESWTEFFLFDGNFLR
jgi:hypothetical protein